MGRLMDGADPVGLVAWIGTAVLAPCSGAWARCFFLGFCGVEVVARLRLPVTEPA